MLRADGDSHLKHNDITFQLVFSVAEDLLKRTTEESKWAMVRAKCGWMIMGALMTLGKNFYSQISSQALISAYSGEYICLSSS